VDLSELSRHKFTVHRLIRKQITRRLSTSQPPSRPSSSDQTVHARRLVTLQRTTAASSASEISCQLPRPRFKNSRPTHGQGRSPEIERVTDSPRRHERGGGGREAQGGDPEARPAAARWLLQGTPCLSDALSPGPPPDLSHPCRRIFFFCIAISGVALAGIPPLLSRCLGHCAV